MAIVVTGSIAYDYLMSFPGRFTEHLLPEHVQRVSLSFLVDTMDKRRGGCAPNIAYTLALLGERPMLMATAGQDFGEYRQWLEAAGVVTVRELKYRNPAKLAKAMADANAKRKMVRILPTEGAVKRWIEAAGKLDPKISY